MTNQKYNIDKQYIESEVWQCCDSPTGAHYWVAEIEHNSLFTCKWCGEDRKFKRSK